jgi:1,2-diacylglycerol 3-alpha-glucosyltransferase
MKIAIVWQRFLPYHVARLKRLRGACEKAGSSLFALEVASSDSSYRDVAVSTHTEFNRICCFPESDYHRLRAKDIYNKVKAALSEIGPDVIFAPATPFPEGMAAIAYRTCCGKKVIVMDDSWELSDRRGPLIKAIKRCIHQNADAVFIPAPSHASYFRGLGFSDDRMVVGVDVVDNDAYAKVAEDVLDHENSVRSSLDLPEDFFLFVGRALPRKGLHSLLSAYDKYCLRSQAGKWDLVIVSSGDEMEQLKASRSAHPHIHFVGPKQGGELYYHYALARALIVPSIVDQWGLVINEGMACGLPVIVSRGCGAAATLVREGENGWTFQPGDVEELSELMIRTTGAGPERLKKMGRRSQEIIAEWGPDRFVTGVFQAANIPRRAPAGIISNLLTRLWKGHVRVY